MIDLSALKNYDPELFAGMDAELNRQRNNIELIASENIVSEKVLLAAGSVLTNKYAEGYPSHRYYGGCEHVDVVEALAIERAKKLFGADHANVQPHCGANANFAVYVALLQPGDTIMGMNLAHGGHLTHGSKANVSGKYFNVVPYGVSKETGAIDYDEVESIALECKPKLIVAGASAYPRVIDFKRFREIADKVGAYLMVDMAHIAGLVATGEHPSPVPYADVVTTTTHKTLRGPRGGMILCREELAKAIDKAVFPGTQGGPLMHIIAGKAVALKEAMSEEFKAYQHQVVLNAKAMENTFKKHGINMVSGGTDNHLILLNLIGTGMTGKELNDLTEQVNITLNKNAVPWDPEKPTITSGVRIGTPAVTTRGFKEADCEKVAELIVKIIKERENCFDYVRAEVKKLIEAHPIYQGVL